MAGKKGRSGRKSIRSILSRFEDTIDESILDITYAQIEKAKQGSTEAARLIYEYRLPRPKTEIGLDLPNTAALAILYRNVLTTSEEESKQLTEGDIIEGEGNNV